MEDSHQVNWFLEKILLPNLIGENSSSPARGEKDREENMVREALNEMHKAREVYKK